MDMKNSSQYRVEYLFLAVVVLLGITGFWDIYFGVGADPDPHQHLHAITNFAWLFLLLCQLTLIARNKRGAHRKVGLAVLIVGPVLVATTAMLSVHSAHKGLVSGRGDFLIVQNVMVALELGFMIFVAFLLRKRRKLHASFILGTAMLFMGIALFFTLISFVPAFRIEGPETFYRFATAAMTGQVTCLVVGLLFVIRDYRSGWPLLLAASFFFLNELIRSFLAGRNLIQPLTELVGSMSQPLTFVGTFVLLSVLLAATGVLRARNDGKGVRDASALNTA